MGDEETQLSADIQSFLFQEPNESERLYLKSSHLRAQSKDDITVDACNGIVLGTANLLSQTSEFDKTDAIQDIIDSLPFCSLSQCMFLLKLFDTVPLASGKAKIIQQCVTLISSRMALLSSMSTPMFSPEFMPSSNDSDESESNSMACLYKDITHISLPMLKRLILAMISHHVDNKFLAKCLLHYLQAAKKRCLKTRDQDTWSSTESVSLDTFESIVALLHKLSNVSVPCKSLFGLQRMACRLKASKVCKLEIEEMIGCQLDKATLDNILIPRQHNGSTLYDVKLVLRLVKLFLQKQADLHPKLDPRPIKKLALVLDMYLAEIAPDPNLTAARFKAIADCLPEFARDSHDELYRALDIFLEAHPSIDEEESIELCRVIDFSKLTPDISKHAAQSLWFPARVTLKALLQEQETFKLAVGHRRHHNQQLGSRQHQHHLKTGDIKKASSSFFGGVKEVHSPIDEEQGLDLSAKSNLRCSQHTSGNGSMQTALPAFSQYGGNQWAPSVTDDDKSPSSCSSFTWERHSTFGQSNDSSSRSLYEQVALDYPDLKVEQEQGELGYHLVLQQNEELKTDLELMRRRVAELEKTCGQMRSKVYNYTRSKRLLC